MSNQHDFFDKKAVPIELAEDDYCHCLQCSGDVFHQSYRVGVVKTALVGERQIVLKGFLCCAVCGAELNPKQAKSQKERLHEKI